MLPKQRAIDYWMLRRQDKHIQTFAGSTTVGTFLRHQGGMESKEFCYGGLYSEEMPCQLDPSVVSPFSRPPNHHRGRPLKESPSSDRVDATTTLFLLSTVAIPGDTSGSVLQQDTTIVFHCMCPSFQTSLQWNRQAELRLEQQGSVCLTTCPILSV